MSVTGLVLSGGRGTRFGASIPKQYLEICEKPVLAYTLEAFQKSGADRIVIVASEDYRELCGKIADHFSCRKVCAVIEGGQERYDSVRKGLQYLQGITDPAQAPEEVVLIHDGARPFIEPEIINRVTDAVRQYGAAIAGTPCTDTIKLVDRDGCILSTTERSLTWAAQTPQGFYLPGIYEAYQQVLEEKKGNDGRSITDDAMVYQMAFPDRKVKMVDAGQRNFKITTAEDLSRSESLLTPTQI